MDEQKVGEVYILTHVDSSGGTLKVFDNYTSVDRYLRLEDPYGSWSPDNMAYTTRYDGTYIVERWNVSHLEVDSPVKEI